MSDSMSSTLSDRELRAIGENRGSAVREYNYMRHGFSAHTIACVLAREAVELRVLVRAFLELHPTGAVADEARRFLGFNITPEQK